jgi:hypothetical protein
MLSYEHFVLNPLSVFAQMVPIVSQKVEKMF